MITKLFTSKLRMELAELKHKHGLELKEKTADFMLAKREWVLEKEQLLKTLKEEHRLKLTEMVTLTKLEGQQLSKRAELDAESKLNSEIKKLTTDHYESLKNAMTKLHEEGNVTTRFTQDLALKMLEGMPSNKSETKVLTGSIDVKS